MTLTPKQEAFAQAIADGMSQTAAYRSVYKITKMKAETVHEVACRMAKSRKVSARLDELRGALASKALWSREDSVTALRDIAVGSESKANEIVAAIKELNAMHGFNAPTKAEISLTFPKVINVIAGRA